MRNHRPAPDERPGLITRLAIATLAFLVSILLAAVAAATPASA
jgi:hypothetical protein